MQKTQAKKILVRLPNWLGDLVMSTGFLNALRTLEPDSSIDVITKDSLGDLTPLIDGINKTYLYSKVQYPGILGSIKFGHRCSLFERYDLFFSLPDSFTSALTAYFSKSKHRIGYSAELRSIFLTHAYKKPSKIHRAEQYLHLLKQYYSNNTLPCIISLKKPQCNIDNTLDLSLESSRLNVIFNIHSAADSRKIPPMKAVSIGKKLISALDCTLIFTGSNSDTDITRMVIKNINIPDKCIDITGKTPLDSLTAICEKSNIIISTDSGVAHIANAVGKPLVVLFGAGNEHNTAPYNKKLLSVVRALDIPCTPCVSNLCRYKHNNCMNYLDEESIISNARVLLGKMS